jgi:polyisoprenoid-binding protein YceI
MFDDPFFRARVDSMLTRDESDPNRRNWSVTQAGGSLRGDGAVNVTTAPAHATPAPRFDRVGERRRFLAVVVTLPLWFASPGAASRQQVDTDRSTITVRVAKAGLFRAFADNHEIQAPIKSGFVEDGVSGRVQVVVDSQRMRVLDPGLSPHDREEVQARMLGPDVLDATRFVEIRFVSTGVEQAAPNAFAVQGALTLHGQTRPVTVKAVRDHDHYRGSASLKQTAFGITPITIAGGAVKVKDEVSIEFDIVTRSTPSLDR